MWKLYDDLINSIPDDVIVSDCLVSGAWTLVRSEGVGVAYPPNVGSCDRLVGNIIGARAKGVAEYIKSWHPVESAVGMAAINSVLNTVTRVEQLIGHSLASEPSVPIFELFADRVKGKKVAVVGHFPALVALGKVCQLSILERNPHNDDYPDPAAEFILPEQEYVFITAATLINKTFPRLLELSKSASVIMVGPSTPLSPVLFDHGLEVLAGSVIVNQEAAWTAVKEGGHRAIFSKGAKMVQISQ